MRFLQSFSRLKVTRTIKSIFNRHSQRVFRGGYAPAGGRGVGSTFFFLALRIVLNNVGNAAMSYT